LLVSLLRYLTMPTDKAEVLATLDGWLSKVTEGNTATLQLIAAMIFLHEDNTKVSLGPKTLFFIKFNRQPQATVLNLLFDSTQEALRCVHLGATMEHLALTVQIFLKMDRPDLALKVSACATSLHL
jgi:hypothetical protein